MRNDEKERAEHVMLVDLGRNDLGRVSEYGSVKVKDLMYVERYSHVMHLVSALEGTLRKGLGAIDAFAACFPAGTLSGAPKVRAMQIIEELEPVRRGIYGGRCCMPISPEIWIRALAFEPCSCRASTLTCRREQASWRT